MDLEELTLNNKYYRKVIYSDFDIQLVLMSLLPGEYIHLEKHTGTQFVRVEGGILTVILEGKTYIVASGGAIIIPPQQYHYLENKGTEDVKLYTIYSPPEHSSTRIEYTDPRTREHIIIRK